MRFISSHVCVCVLMCAHIYMCVHLHVTFSTWDSEAGGSGVQDYPRLHSEFEARDSVSKYLLKGVRYI